MHIDAYVKNFETVKKRILKQNLSKNPVTLNKYRTDIVEVYNNLANYCKIARATCDDTQKKILKTTYADIRAKLFRCLNKLGCIFRIEDVYYAILDINEVGLPRIPESETIEEPEIDLDISYIFKMADITVIDFLKLCGETIPTHFNGDPLLLMPFLNSIDLLNSVASSAGNANVLTATLINFIKARLTSKSLDNLTTTDVTIDDIKNRLTNTTKPDNEKIVRGKMAALRMDRNSMADFSKQAENLADALKRSLTIDGIPSEKANQMVIDETIVMCKNSARSDYVKAVLASATYKNAKEVVAKFVVEVGNEKADKQVLAFRSNNYAKKQNGQYRGQNGQRYNKGYKNQFYKNGKPQNNRYQYNGRNNNFRRNHYKKNIHVTQAGNPEAPQRLLGDPNRESE